MTSRNSSQTHAAEAGKRVSVFALSIHADYRCRHSGVCCTSDWDVPVDVPLYRSLDEAVGAGKVGFVATAHDGTGPLLTGTDLPDDAAAMVARTTSGDCVFYHRPSGLCAVHRDLGEPMLPATCRHFPRLAVRDARGTFVSLSHYCPTAADMLFRDDLTVSIVEDPPAFPELDYEGLTVSGEDWPPLLSPTTLTDLDGYGAWERHMVATCADTTLTAESVVATLERDARIARQTRPGKGMSIAESIACLPGGMHWAVPDTLDESLRRHVEVMNAVPDEWRPAPDEHGLASAYRADVWPRWDEWQMPLKRYLAAKAFASWTAYQGRGLLTIVRGLEAALALVRVEAARQCRNSGRSLDRDSLKEAFRQADFVLNHLAGGEELAAAWSVAEQ